MAPRQRRKSAWLNAPADRPPFIIRELIDDPQNNNNDAKHSSSLFNIIVEAMKQTFLPEGFPSSTPPDYLPFQAWDTLQAICSYVRGMLCSAAVMRGVGVGSDQATAYGAVFMFAVRDLTGMLGGLAFAHTQGSGFDGCAKQWRLFADVTNDLAMALDLASPLFPKAFLVMACLGSLARAMTSVAGGATRAALTQHFSRCSGKAADVAAKEQSQETAVTILGTLIGIFLSRVCKESQGWVWSSFVLLTWLHIWANLKAVRSLVLTSMNRPRLDAILTKQMKDGGGIVITPDEMKDIEDLTPPPLAALIRYVNPFQLKGARMPDLRMGVSLSHLREVLSERGLSDALQSVEGQKEGRYLVVSEKELVGKGQGVVRYIIFHKAAQPRDVILAYCHAYMAALGLDDGDAKSRSVSLVDNLERAGWDVAGRNSVIVGKCIYHDW